jgi:hypothetical protein
MANKTSPSKVGPFRAAHPDRADVLRSDPVEFSTQAKTHVSGVFLFLIFHNLLGLSLGRTDRKE